MDMVDSIRITIEKEDTIETISGLGGIEFAYKKKVDSIKFGGLKTKTLIVILELWF